MNLLDLLSENMQKSKNKGFTLIELLIVIAIIAIMSVIWISSFSRQIDSFRNQKILWNILWDIRSLDNKVANKDIFDYKIQFLKDKKYYIISENTFDIDYSLEFDDSGSWKIEFSWATSWSWIIKYYKNYKFQKWEEIAYDSSLTWTFDVEWYYKINWSFSWETLNTLYIKYYSTQKDNEFKLKSNNCIITNILWKKTFSSPSCDTLKFENTLWEKVDLKLK